MAAVFVFILVLWITSINFIDANNLCEERYSSITPEHTMCKNESDDCKFLMPQRNIFDKQLLHTHNMIRNSIRRFVGKEYHHATNMKLLQWDDELYEMAKMHSRQCVEEPDCDLCHQTDRFPVEQNFAVKTFKELKVEGNGLVKRFQKVIKEWAAELGEYNPNAVNSFTPEDELPTNWTNILRAKTLFVGCASMNFLGDEPGTFIEVYVCNYGPANLTEGEEIYETGGKPCSDCDYDEICDDEFTRMCAPTDLKVNITVILSDEEEMTTGNYSSKEDLRTILEPNSEEESTGWELENKSNMGTTYEEEVETFISTTGSSISWEESTSSSISWEESSPSSISWEESSPSSKSWEESSPSSISWEESSPSSISWEESSPSSISWEESSPSSKSWEETSPSSRSWEESSPSSRSWEESSPSSISWEESSPSSISWEESSPSSISWEESSSSSINWEESSPSRISWKESSPSSIS